MKLIRTDGEGGRESEWLPSMEDARLLNVARVVHGQIGAEIEHVSCLHDHKGFLTVTWSHPPSAYAVCCFGEAWEGEGEIKDTVAHDWSASGYTATGLLSAPGRAS